MRNLKLSPTDYLPHPNPVVQAAAEDLADLGLAMHKAMVASAEGTGTVAHFHALRRRYDAAKDRLGNVINFGACPDSLVFWKRDRKRSARPTSSRTSMHERSHS